MPIMALSLVSLVLAADFNLEAELRRSGLSDEAKEFISSTLRKPTVKLKEEDERALDAMREAFEKQNLDAGIRKHGGIRSEFDPPAVDPEKLKRLTKAQKEQVKAERERLLAQQKKETTQKFEAEVLAEVRRLDKLIMKSHGENNTIPVPKRIKVPNGKPRLPDHLPGIGDEFIGVLDAIGVMGPCTVAHVGRGLALTAGHCFSMERGYTAFDRPCSKRVKWGQLGDGTPSGESSCARLIAAEFDDVRDYALFRVDDPPPVSFVLQLNPAPALGATVVLAGYESARLRFSPRCTLLSPHEVKLEPNAPKFGHHCDAVREASGGPVIDVANRRLVAIHNGGEYGDPLPEPEGGYVALNWATRLDAKQLDSHLADAGVQ